LLLKVLLVAAHGAPWYDRASDSLPNIAELLTALVAAAAVVGFVRARLRRTLWRRRDRYARLARLGTNAQLSFFSSVLGEPPATRRTVHGQMTSYDDMGRPQFAPKEFTEAVWIDRDFYVHTIADSDASVQAYSVTTRSKRFRPKFYPPGGYYAQRRWPLRRWERFRYRTIANAGVTLGKTRLIELGQPDCAASWLGAHNWHYFEKHYLGNPGYYQTFVYSINDAGAASDAPFDQMQPDISYGFDSSPIDAGLALEQAAAQADAAADDALPTAGASGNDVEIDVGELAADVEDPPLPEALQTFRRRARVNTYTVIAPDLAIDDYPGVEGRLDQYPVTFGVSSYRVRTLG
jgi:hypothetical protein